MGRLPSGYVELTHITATGSQNLDTGVIPSNHMIEVVYRNDTYVNDAHIFGTNAYNAACYTHFTTYSNKYYWGKNNAEESGGSWSDGLHSLKFNYGDNYDVALDDVVLGSGFSTSSSNLLLGCRGGTTNFVGDYVSVKITDRSTGNLVREYVPAKQLSNNDIGLYDLVTESFNAGTGTFIGGHQVLDPIIPTWGSGLASVNKSAIIRRRGLMGADGNLWLYKDGDECIDVTGGWSDGYIGCGTATFVKGASDISYTIKKTTGSWSEYVQCMLHTNNLIDFSGYTKLNIEVLSEITIGETYGNECTVLYVLNSNSYDTLAVLTQEQGIDIAYMKFLSHQDWRGTYTKNTTTRTLFQYDISSITGELYVGLYSKVITLNRQSNSSLFRLWLEK